MWTPGTKVTLSLGLTAEATSLRLAKSSVELTFVITPRLNCRGNFVEAPRRHAAGRRRFCLGLTAEATSLRHAGRRGPRREPHPASA